MRWWLCVLRRSAQRLVVMALGLGLLVACLTLLSALGGDPEGGEGGAGLKDDPPWPPNPLAHDPLAFEDFKGEGEGEAFATEAEEELEESARGSQEYYDLLVSSSSPNSLLERLLPGDPPLRTLWTLNMSRPAVPSLFCLVTRTTPEYQICPHTAATDRYISAQLLTDGTWEPHILALFRLALKYYPSCTVIDLGAHVGVYTLLAGAVGVPAVAVEPVWASAVRIHAGARAGKVEDKITILLHAAAHARVRAKLRYKRGNLGGTSVQEIGFAEYEKLKKRRPRDVVTTVSLNDLAPFVNTSVVVIKIDIEGWECQAILGGTGFLASHFAPYVFMEWAVVSNNRHKYHAPCRPAHLQRMIQWFASRGYHAHISKSGVELNPARLETWRAGDIYWRHRTAPRLQQHG